MSGCRSVAGRLFHDSFDPATRISCLPDEWWFCGTVRACIGPQREGTKHTLDALHINVRLEKDATDRDR